MNLLEQYSDEQLIKMLKDLSKKIGRTPYGNDIDKDGRTKYWVYYKRFGSLVKSPGKGRACAYQKQQCTKIHP